MPAARPTGIPAVQELSWGSHIAHFYKTREDFVDSILPYFQAGLTANERCLWIATEPFGVKDAWSALRASVPDLDRYVRKEQIQILSYEQGYGTLEKLTASDIQPQLESWLQREEEALALGFAGLRVSGNPFHLPASSWNLFAQYESRASEVLRDRRILALCSYSLARCGAREIGDMLRHHRFALVRSQGRWQIADDPQSLLAARRPAAASPATPTAAHPGHAVQFYQGAPFLARQVAAFVSEGLARQEAVIVISTAAHARLMTEGLQASGHDLVRLRESGRLAVLDARATLGQILIDGTPNEDLFNEVIGGLIADSRASFGAVRAYGEMVDILTCDGRGHEALMLERLWNKLLERESFSLLCAYALEGFTTAHSESFARACREHARVIPAEEPIPSTVATSQLVAEWQHQAKVIELQAETLRAVVQDRTLLIRHLSLLQKVAAALVTAATPTEVARVVVTTTASVLEADEAVFGLVEEDGTSRPLLALDATRHVRTGAQVLTAMPLPPAALLDDRSAWLVGRDLTARHPEQEGRFRALAIFPLRARGRTLGIACFGFRREENLGPALHLLAEDLMSQASLALDRSLLVRTAEEEHELALRATRNQGEFMAMLGHALRHPLAPLVSALEVMRLRAGSVHEHERALIDRQVRHVVQMVDDLIELSRMTTGEMDLRKSVTEVQRVVASAVERAAVDLRARRHDLVVDVPMQGLAIEADRELLGRALTNVLSNAALYTAPHGRIAITAARDGDRVKVEVRDTGVGIEPGLLPRLFDLFVQGRRSARRPEGGLGAGLAIARMLVEKHGGTITAHSDGLGKGSTFTLLLPAAPAPTNDER